MGDMVQWDCTAQLNLFVAIQEVYLLTISSPFTFIFLPSIYGKIFLIKSGSIVRSTSLANLKISSVAESVCYYWPK
uniref:Uncharacterized protein n=1 Tax=Rhizophora mucronata TaxID=61149 RepID=A0A2P2JFX0_RHIMU